MSPFPEALAPLLILPAAAGDAAALSQMHASCFSHGWNEAEFASMLASSGVFAFIARGREGDRQGFILCRNAADECELITLAVPEAFRRRGVGRALLGEACRYAYEHRVTSMYLEVAENNHAARGMYEKAGFIKVGVRKEYYQRLHDNRDAITMRCDLNAATQ